MSTRTPSGTTSPASRTGARTRRRRTPASNGGTPSSADRAPERSARSATASSSAAAPTASPSGRTPRPRTPRPPRGALIVVEGIDGSGKSTQLYLLKRWLELTGYNVFFTEWNSSELVREATKRGKKKSLFTPQTFSLIHATDFADRFERQIRPLLQSGYLVLADRYIYTAFARDVARGNREDWVRNLYSFAIKPDLTFYFRTPLQVALDRILGGRPQLKYYEAGLDLGLSKDPYESFRLFQGMIVENYERFTQRDRFVVMDATAPIREQQREMRRIVAEKVDLSRFRKAVVKAIAPIVDESREETN